MHGLCWNFLYFSDVDTNKPDEKSVITYVASYYHTFARMKSEMKGGKRIANVSLKGYFLYYSFIMIAMQSCNWCACVSKFYSSEFYLKLSFL